jgi:type IV pilus assembly protein PilM
MASQVIGLDIGTHAVRAVELSLGRGLPVVRRMAQVALPPGAVAAGEVLDPPAVASALKRLWKEGGFRKRSVVVGVANQRVVARVTDLPALPDEELRTALPYQVQDLIPIPIDEAQLDFQVIHRVGHEGGEEQVRVMLVAAHRDMLRSLMAALDGAGLRAERIDVVPFALVRALYDPTAWLDDGSDGGREEVVVGVGAGVTNVVAHDAGIPRFVRTLPTGGLAVTEAVASQLGVDAEVAEGLKRGLPGQAAAAQLEHLQAVSTHAVDPLVSEIAGSLDFYLAQSEDTAVRRVVLTGGGARLAQLRVGLAEALGVEVVEADPFSQVSLGKVGLAPDVVAANSDVFTVAIGLALSEQALDGDGHRITLLPAEVTAKRAERRQIVLAGAGLATFAALLLGVSYLRGAEVQDARAKADLAEQTVADLQSQVAALQGVAALENDIAARRGTVQGVLEGDVDWTGLFHEVTALLPNDVWLTSFTGTRAGAAGGTIRVSAVGFDHTSTARWLLRMADLDAIDGVWVPSSQRSEINGKPTVDFSSDARLTTAAESDRAEKIGGEAG